ncbi:MAG: exodeoxyribonuclease VII large subunit [Lentisphaeria bacterium]
MPDKEKIWTISEVNRLVKDVLEQSFYPFWVRGEVGNLTVHRSGHVYLTLKDSRTQLKCVYFRAAAEVRKMDLKVGAKVEAFGRLGVYEPRGEYQMVVNRLRPLGKGDLQRLFEELKKKLREEGLFDDERKRPIPALPRCIGVVTSPQGAALRDFLQVLGRRFANVRVRIFPAAVQGEGAAAQIAGGIEFFNQTKSCDVIVVTRGGGSLEDLWAFNEEIVARAVSASEIPVISAVGHEVDFSICDYTADLRVPTPSAAGELVIGRKADMLEKIQTCDQRLRSALRLQTGDLKRRVERAAGSYVFREPANLVRTYQQQVDELVSRSTRQMAKNIEIYSHKLAHLRQQLQALNPGRVLERGYSILLNDKEEAVTQAGSVETGGRLRGILAHGELDLEAVSIRPETQSDSVEKS